MSDRLEELRHELADIDAALGEAGAGPALGERKAAVEAEILQLERASREEIGVQPAAVEVLDADPAAFRNPAEELVVPALPPASTELQQATMVVLDRHDEDQVMAILEERYDPVMMFDFDRSGTRVRDLSVKGVLECARLLNATGHARIRAMPNTVTFGSDFRDVGKGNEEFVVCTIAAADEVSGLVVLGTAMEPVLMRLKNDKTKFDVFCRAKALSKAQRNALKGHIPERLRQAMLALFAKDDRRMLEVKHGAGAAAAAQLPPPLATPEAEALESECRDIWAAIRGLEGWRNHMLPGVFGAKLSRARSSLVDLEAFRDLLLSLKEKLEDEGR